MKFLIVRTRVQKLEKRSPFFSTLYIACLRKSCLRDFYLSPEFKQVHETYGSNEIQDLVDRIGESAAVAILEGTGTYYYFWKEQLQKKAIFVLVADQVMVKSTRRSLGGTDNKDDEFDASSDV